MQLRENQRKMKEDERQNASQKVTLEENNDLEIEKKMKRSTDQKENRGKLILWGRWQLQQTEAK